MNEFYDTLRLLGDLTTSNKQQKGLENLIFFFFLNQQFITRSTVADCGSYFITTYNRSRLHEEKKKKKENEKRKTKKTNHTEVKRKERKQIR